MINKNTCRLKDIKDVFLDTGLDFKSYSILEQGRIGEILNSKPLERRFIIEEVAGVMKYKVRKAEALSKLESSRLNLIRINDIIAEVRKQINILDRLAKKAERYKKLSSEMHAIEQDSAKRIQADKGSLQPDQRRVYFAQERGGCGRRDNRDRKQNRDKARLPS
jgi:chromosome segregation protein